MKFLRRREELVQELEVPARQVSARITESCGRTAPTVREPDGWRITAQYRPVAQSVGTHSEIKHAAFSFLF